MYVPEVEVVSTCSYVISSSLLGFVSIWNWVRNLGSSMIRERKGFEMKRGFLLGLFLLWALNSGDTPSNHVVHNLTIRAPLLIIPLLIPHRLSHSP